MKNRTIYLTIVLLSVAFANVYAQYGHGGHGHHGGNHNGDSSRHGGFIPPKVEKGPHKGKMIVKEGLKVEMVPPSNDKGDAIAYYVYDSLNAMVDAKGFSGTVKYIFGGPNEYLETKLITSGASNQYTATLEGWQEYKKAIVTLKGGDKAYTFYFANFVPGQNSSADGQGGHHGGHGGHHGGGGGNGMGSIGSGGMGGSQGSGNGY